MDNWLEARFSVAVVIERKWYGFVLNTVKVLRRSDIEMDNWFEAKFSVAVVIEQMWYGFVLNTVKVKYYEEVILKCLSEMIKNL